MSGGPFVLAFDEIGLDDVARVGGKNASLGELLRTLAPTGVRVPGGFAITADGFRAHLDATGEADRVYAELDALDPSDTAALARTGASIRARIEAAPLPETVRAAALAAYRGLGDEVAVAVRSSATAEDLPTASFAGQHETYLNVRGEADLDLAVRRCMASLFTDRAIVYRTEQGFPHRQVALSVGVQRMVRSDLACAGTMFTLDTESGHRGVVLVDGAWGLGESVVKGRVDPDEFMVHKASLDAGFRAVFRRTLGTKARRLVLADAGAAREAVREEDVPPADRARFVLDDDEVLELARWAMRIEARYAELAGRDEMPMDVEWAKDGTTGALFVVQARPETVHARTGAAALETDRLEADAPVLLEGRAVGSRIGAGRVRIVHGTEDLADFREGEVLVAEMTDPDWEPVLRRAAAVVTDRGGRTCHAAIVSREMGLPCVVGTGTATSALAAGREVTVSCAGGSTGRVLDGRVPFRREVLDPSSLPEPRVPLMLNLADPGRAFALAQLPAAGVGLMRMEFVINHLIGVHPMALLHPERVTDPAVRAEVLRRAAGHRTPPDHFVDRLAEGVATIGAAFHPRPVIVRFSDFKTNEYAGLLGGADFEPVEANPMIGFRGASRYADDRYREAFALECAAIRRVRDEIGLRNVIVMIPFCRTLGEARAVLDEMARHGLVRGEHDMRVYVMCEIPNNVILADEFAELFDGFSIGSNDLTQLVLGVDRDSELLGATFDEQDPGVKRMISMVIERAHAGGRPVGICGEAPSNHPAFAEWLADEGIDSMSLSPDSLPTVARRLAAT